MPSEACDDTDQVFRVLQGRLKILSNCALFLFFETGVVVRDLASVDYVMGERRCVMSSGNPEPYAVSAV